MKDRNLFHLVNTIGNIFTRGFATRENITDGVHSIKKKFDLKPKKTNILYIYIYPITKHSSQTLTITSDEQVKCSTVRKVHSERNSYLYNVNFHCRGRADSNLLELVVQSKFNYEIKYVEINLLRHIDDFDAPEEKAF